MSKRSDKLLLEDILEVIESILSTRMTLPLKNSSQKKTKDAVVRNFEIIGEAANKLSRELKENNRQIDWQGIIGFRNVIVHDYFGVDYEVVWNIKSNQLPKLKEEIGHLVNKY